MDVFGSTPGRRLGRGVLLVCLGAAGGAAIGSELFKRWVRRRFLEEERNLPPVAPDAVAQRFADIPLYPGAELDLEETRRAPLAGLPARLTFGRMPIMRDVMARVEAAEAYAVYAVSASPADVAAWYDREMAAVGWVPYQLPETPRWVTVLASAAAPRRPEGQPLRRFYDRGEEQLWVFVALPAGDGPARLHVSRHPKPSCGQPSA